ncbi:MAG: HK97 gp10 family phage protein [Oscillospiraceae bacterium]
MSKEIEIGEFANEIVKQLKNYSAEVDEIMQEEIIDVAKETVKNLKKNTIVPQKTGKYKKSFYYKKIASGKGYRRMSVGNRVYQLTHLLEFGHVTRNGKRTKAFPHWLLAQENSKKLLEEKIIRRLSSEK